MNDVLQFFPTSEGYVSVTGTNYNYVFNYTDHLGNIRLSYTKDPATGVLKILEQSHYYPYGMKHSNYNESKYELQHEEGGVSIILKPVVRSGYQYKYNGQEYQDELGLNLYDMDFRVYDPAIARWTGIDPVVHYSQSTYNAFDGNPVFWADPSGADSSSGGFSTDVFGRERFDNYGIYIPFGERVGSNFENYFKDESISDDGRGYEDEMSFDQNKFDYTNNGEYFASQEELEAYINKYIGNLELIEKALKTVITLSSPDNLPPGYTMVGNDVFNLKSKPVGGTTMPTGKDSSKIFITPSIKGDFFGLVKVTSQTIVHELIHAYHRSLKLPNFNKYTEFAASTYTYAYLKAYGSKNSAIFYLPLVKPYPKTFSWRNLPNYIKTGIK